MKHICLLLFLVSLSANAQREIKDDRLIVGTASNVDILFEMGANGATNPAIMWDESDAAVKFSKNGTDFFELTGKTDTATLTNKSLSDTTSAIVDASDSSKKLLFNIGGTTGTVTTIETSQTANRNIVLPNWNTTLVGDDATQTLTGKTIDGDLNTVQDLSDSSIKTGAAINAAKIADGTVSSAEFQYLDATSSIQTQLNAKANASAVSNVDNTSDSTKNAAAVTLTNKTINADSNTITNIENADIKSGAAIDAAKIGDGSVSTSEYQFINSLSSNAQTQIDSKAPTAGPTFTGNVTVPDQTASAGTDYAVNAQYVDAAIAGVVAGGVNDASAVTKGIIQLTGDLGGTAASPTVPGLSSKQGTLTNSAGLASALSDETGTGLAVFNTAASFSGLSAFLNSTADGLVATMYGTTAATSNTNNLINFKRTTSGDMTDGFGERLNFQIEDNAGVGNTLGYFGFRRKGADNSGQFFLTTRSTGSDTGQFFIDPDGDVGIGGEASASAALEITSTTRGFLPPRMTTTQRNAISAPATGLEVYNTTTGQSESYSGSTWKAMGSSIFSVSVSATEVLTENDSSFLASCTNADPAVCTLTASFFSADPKCWANPILAATVAIVIGDTTTTVTVDRTDAATAFTLFCHGVR